MFKSTWAALMKWWYPEVERPLLHFGNSSVIERMMNAPVQSIESNSIEGNNLARDLSSYQLCVCENYHLTKIQEESEEKDYEPSNELGEASIRY